ncbi:MAG: glycoside hydrolase family 2 protein [Verrucomicrobiota bacterium]
MISNQCLNGWWDFLPVDTTTEIPAQVPATGWNAEAVLTPSWWTKSRFAVRRRGERHYRGLKATDAYHEEDEFLFDAYGYPLEWAQKRSGWLRREWVQEKQAAGTRSVLTLKGVMPRGALFVNGKFVCEHDDPGLRWMADITDFLCEGKNELAVFIADFRRDDRGRPLVPCGNEFHMTAHCGITGDVFLSTHPAVSIDHTKIRAVDTHTIDVVWELRNDSDKAAAITLHPDLAEWAKDADTWGMSSVLSCAPIEVELAAGSSHEVSARVHFPDAKLWDNFTPNLYLLRARLLVNGQESDRASERFGFRTIAIEGKDILLNGQPVHFFSDWGHKATPYHLTESWVRQWFGMLRDAHMNQTRLHAYVHDERFLAIADEMGIFITIETSIHGSGGEQGSDSPEYWEAARKQVRGIVKYYSNHPCVVLWSVENEMRWNRDTTPLYKEELPKLRHLFNELDPTRPAYHEGDTSLWDESELEINNRHYGKEVAGCGWWDQKRPLHAGEMSIHHLMGANNTLALGGDGVFENYANIERSASEDALLIIESARIRGVCLLAPWNLSCNVNPRMDAELVRLDYDDWNAPGAKPLIVPPHSSEFAFWKPEEKGYTASVAFDLMQQAFRPVAVIDESRRSQYHAGAKVLRHLHVVNDSARDLKGTLRVHLGGKLIHESVVAVKRGRVESVEVSWTIADVSTNGEHAYAVSLESDAGSDSWERPWFIAKPFASSRSLEGMSVTLVGSEGLSETLVKLGASVRCIATLEEVDTASDRVVLVASFAIKATAASRLRALLDAGLRIVVLEQTASIFPGSPMKEQSVVTAWRRSPLHPVFENIDDTLLCFWGETPFPALDGDHFVIRSAYTKGDARHAACLADTGDGGFGNGDLEGQALLEIEDGAGLLLACQLRIGERFGDLPVAELLLTNMLRHAASWSPRSLREVETTKEFSKSLLEKAAKGATIIVSNPTDAVLADWGGALAVRLEARVDPNGIYQAVRASGAGHPLVQSVSNHDLCGIETWTYSWSNLPNKAVASRLLIPVARLEELFVTAQRSALRELYVYDGSSEMLRAHTASRFCYGNELAEYGVIAGVVHHGKGCVILSLLDDAAEAPSRLSRCLNAIRRNAGEKLNDRIWDVPVVESENRSDGFPTKIYRCLEAHNAESLTRLVAATKPLQDFFGSRQMLTQSRWEEIEIKDGWITAENMETVILAGTIQSPRARKNREISVLNCPNPEEQVFCDFEGEGTAIFHLNTAAIAQVDLASRVVTVPDIDLEAGNNHYLIVWNPSKAGAKLRMDWRNIMRTPERTLLFF